MTDSDGCLTANVVLERVRVCLSHGLCVTAHCQYVQVYGMVERRDNMCLKQMPFSVSNLVGQGFQSHVRHVKLMELCTWKHANLKALSDNVDGVYYMVICSNRAIDNQ